MSTKASAGHELIKPAPIVADSISYEPVATAIPSSAVLDKPMRTVNEEYMSIPETQGLTWEDDFFDDDDVVAVFDFDYMAMEAFYTNVGWAYIGATLLYMPFFWLAMSGCVPCYLRKNVSWNVNAQHVAITRDGIRFVRDKRRTCWGMPCTDAGKNSKTVPFDKITDCDIVEPAGNTCLCVTNVLSTVNIDTASSGSPGGHELTIAGLKDPYGFKKLVWAMKRSHSSSIGTLAPASIEMVGRPSDDGVSSLLRDIRDELRENNALLQNLNRDAMPSAVPLNECNPPATNPDL